MTSNCTLSEGALQVIMQGGNVTDPIVQVLRSERMNTPNINSDRYRIQLSDGRYSISNAVLTKIANIKYGSNGLQMFSVLKLKKYLTTVTNNTGNTDSRRLLIVDGEMLVDGNTIGEKIGSSTPLSMTDIQQPSTSVSPYQNSVVRRQQRMASNCILTKGALQIIMQGGNVTDPVVQILDSKKMNADSDRYRILLSDGQYSISAMLTRTTNTKFGGSGLQTFSVFKLKKYLITVANVTRNSKLHVLLIIDVEMLVDGNTIGEKIGSPTQLGMLTLF